MPRISIIFRLHFVFTDYFFTVYEYILWYSNPSHNRNGIASERLMSNSFPFRLIPFVISTFLNENLNYLRNWQRLM